LEKGTQEEVTALKKWEKGNACRGKLQRQVCKGYPFQRTVISKGARPEDGRGKLKRRGEKKVEERNFIISVIRYCGDRQPNGQGLTSEEGLVRTKLNGGEKGAQRRYSFYSKANWSKRIVNFTKKKGGNERCRARGRKLIIKAGGPL